MCIVANYYKLGNTWYLDLPEYLQKPGAHEEDLERIGAFHDFLEIASDGKPVVKLEITNESSDNADILQLSGFPGDDSGAYYYLKEFNGQHIDLELWFNQVIYHFVEKPPEKLYIKQLYQ
jgi:hypothetical protein